MPAGDNEAVLREAFQALSEGDLSVVERTFAPEAQWRGVEPGTLCAGRAEIVKVMRRNRSSGVRGTIAEMAEHDPYVLVGFRPAQPREDGRPLEQGVAYAVVKMRDGLVLELKGCADLASALAYIAAGAAA
ncbi:MAG TPA: nuclear transport factor 2 family protein [Solirubrobacteraceae bacterium]|jgi:ketosteroid isomerase-like protein|nr:nuclear transport factor 2 family protein [Solirubrobacteraceae bacterium]